MGKARPAAENGVTAGERWEARRGRLYLAGVRAVHLADFSLDGRIARDVAQDRAQLAAQAPSMYLALLASVSEARACGYFEQTPYHPKARCDCGECQGLRAIALAEGGGRCILCGCTEFDACSSGCGWADPEQLVCTAHPPAMIRAALRQLQGGGRHA